jgi:hypothetical protein
VCEALKSCSPSVGGREHVGARPQPNKCRTIRCKVTHTILQGDNIVRVVMHFEDVV